MSMSKADEFRQSTAEFWSKMDQKVGSGRGPPQADAGAFRQDGCRQHAEGPRGGHGSQNEEAQQALIGLARDKARCAFRRDQVRVTWERYLGTIQAKHTWCRGLEINQREHPGMPQDSRIAQQETYMKTMTTLLATAALITGIAAANAQGTTRQMDEQAGGNSGVVERNPDGSTGGSKSNPSPTTGAGGTMGGTNGTLKQDEKAGGNNRAVEREGMGGKPIRVRSDK